MEEKQKVFRIGPIRPPSEANSLLLQITEGCTWNRCKFCQLYKHSSFKAFSVDSIKNDIDMMAEYAEIARKYQRDDGSWNHKAFAEEMESMTYAEQNCFYMIYQWLINGGENVFLQDGNSLALRSQRVVEVLTYLRKRFPLIKRVTTYGRAETLSKISVEEYKELKAAGLDRIHSGFESGSDKVLELISKGVTAEQEITAGKNIKAAGIELSVYFMAGVGGKDLSEENALETARVVREINPDFVRIRTAVIKEGTELWREYQKGAYKLCSDNDKLLEIRKLIEYSQGCTGILVSDHIINLMQEVFGRLDQDREKMLSMIDRYFALPPDEQRLFQLARRSGMVSSLEDMSKIPKNRLLQMEQVCSRITDDSEWDEKINEMMMSYI
ncbi:radical SAM protein [Sinanaerobacter chloroacetimidivorans]|uniref:Radical SAM protein n=1 Tax=Sinanaerobacter chloroacetimidivorans TaxID=2818044 RepID=A0A8J7W4G2_9FIRM|nr:radical SAM protein [Sinanaerobacter chloroacetimidivorans]MBR0599173.1 radical SAM protein [Sinanaerobacter chloroacetimidivorans]